MSGVVLGDDNITINGKILEVGKSVGLTPKVGANPIVTTIERMYPPIRNISSENHQITGHSYGNGLYVTSFSTAHGAFFPWECFNISNTTGGHWANNRYTQPNGTFNAGLTNNLVPGYVGDWLAIQFPVAINLTRYAFNSGGSRAPGNFKIYGSNNGTTWVELTHETNAIYVNGLYDKPISTSVSYNRFGLVVNKLLGGDANAIVLQFDEWFIYGTEILNKSINDDYGYIPFTYGTTEFQDDRTNLLAHYKFNGNLLDSSGNNRTLSQVGTINYDTTLDNKFPYSQYIFSTDTRNTSYTVTPDINRNVPLSIAFWFFVSGSGYYTMMGYGSYPNPSIQFDYEPGNIFRIYTALNNLWTTSPAVSGLSLNTWYHCAYTLNNSATVQTILYLNGVSRATGTGNANATLRTSRHLVIGESGDGGRGFLGRIGDVRIYNRVLTPHEVLQLYYVKEQSSYSITFPEQTECDILVVGGGGAGGDGGGGGGQLIYMQNQLLIGQYTINVGSGGDGGGFRRQGGNGDNSSITNTTTGVSTLSFGGGGGGGVNTSVMPTYSVSVGSGGGSGFDANNQLFAITNYTNRLNGFRGSISPGFSHSSAGGGGGAGGFAPNIFLTNDNAVIGNNTLKMSIANGGIGLQNNITGRNEYYAGGGAGGVNTGTGSSSVIPTGGLGGGGNGTTINIGRGTAGAPNTGGGGGGCDPENPLGGLNGGSGIVIIRYKIIKQNFDARWTHSSTNPNVYHMGNVGIGTTNPTSALSVIGSIDIDGSISALYKTFKIEHPLNINKWLYHGCVEGPRFDNIYRGKKITIGGKCEIDIDKECNTVGGMSEGTFDALNTSCQLYVMNNQTYDRVNGKIDSGKITINCENITDNIEIDWLVIGERKDEQIANVPYTDDEGKLICEHNI